MDIINIKTETGQIELLEAMEKYLDTMPISYYRTLINECYWLGVERVRLYPEGIFYEYVVNDGLAYKDVFISIGFNGRIGILEVDKDTEDVLYEKEYFIFTVKK